MKKIFILLIGLTCCLTSQAQQPFKEYGYKVKVATLSQGKYVEFFDQDTVVQIGTVLLNRRSGKIVSFVQYDTTFSEYSLQPELISRWMSPDPLAEEFYSESPYNFSHNNPIRYVDPDGRAPIDSNCPDCPTGQVLIRDDQVLAYFAGNFIAAGKNVISTIGGFLKSGTYTPFIVRQQYTVAADVNGELFIHESKPYLQDKASAALFGVIDGASMSMGGGPAGMLAKSGAGPSVGKNVKEILKIDIDPKNKVSRELLDPPTTPGNAPTFKSDGSSVEIHHVNQNAKGPFIEMHKKDHRMGENYRSNHPSGQTPLNKDERKEFEKAKREYWKSQYPNKD